MWYAKGLLGRFILLFGFDDDANSSTTIRSRGSFLASYGKISDAGRSTDMFVHIYLHVLATRIS